MSSTSPRGSGERRRDVRRGRVRAIAAMSRRTRSNSSGVISAKSFSRRSSCPEAPSSCGVDGLVRLVLVRPRLERVAHDAIREAARLLLAHERRDRPAQEPRDERAVEELELVVARDERLPEREVDVVLAREVDGVERANGVGDTPRTDLDPHLPQHPAEGHDVPHDRGALHAAPSGSRSRGPLR